MDTRFFSVHGQNAGEIDNLKDQGLLICVGDKCYRIKNNLLVNLLKLGERELFMWKFFVY